MSAQPVGWVMRHSPMTGAAFAVHMALADSASDQNGYRIWMKHSTIAAKARVTRGSVVKAMRDLEEAGLLTKVEDRAAMGQANVYVMEMPVGAAVVFDPQTLRAERAGGARSADKGCAQNAQGVRAQRATRTQEEPKKNPNINARSSNAATSGTPTEQLGLVAENGDRVQVADAIDELFDDWWDAYPRKIGKKLARAKWRQVVRELGGIAKAEPVLVEGGNRWLQHWRREKTPPALIPHPTTWLNRGDYEAEPVPTDTARRAR